MTTKKTPKTCLLITYGPVPTPQYQTVEGGGMRAWGLARGLVQSGISATVAVNSSFPQDLESHESVTLTNWELNENFAALINSYDSVIISYCMGDASEFVARNIKDRVQLILDAYVPIYVEVSARDSEDADREYVGYMREVERYNSVLQRGDYFLCANETQKTFYTGVLSSLEVVNPRSYRQHRLLVVPFGLHDVSIDSSINPYLELGIKKDDFVVLWFGGLYPWFRIEEYLGAIEGLQADKKIKFVFVGSKNPFNSNADFIRQHTKAYNFAKSKKLLGKSVYFVDWVDFDKRIDWFEHADMVVSLNQPGEENAFSWRTRVMDFVWGEMAIITNGGDPLSEELITAKAAFRLKELTAQELGSQIASLDKDRSKLASVRKNIRNVKQAYYWKNLVLPIVDVINSHTKFFADEQKYRKKLGLAYIASEKGSKASSRPAKLVKKALAPTRYLNTVYSFARKKGLKSSLRQGASMVKNQAKLRLGGNEKKFIFISNSIDNTGAPLVLMQIVEEFTKKYGANRIQIITSHISPQMLRQLRERGMKVDKGAEAFGKKLIKLQLNLKPDDFVLINTIAVHDNYRRFIFSALKHHQLKHATWFIHEDEAQIKNIAPHLLQSRNISNIHKLIQKGQLDVFLPSARTKDSYNKIFKTKKVQLMPLRLNIDEKYFLKRTAKDYESIDFLLTGSPADGRKGQLIAIAAMQQFFEEYYRDNPDRYRDFHLHLVGMGDDFYSQQIKWIGKSSLKDRLVLYPSVPFKKVLTIAERCNAVICCSLNETFALYVAEGMYMGDIVLRNDSAGRVEQLKEGKNGYFIDNTDINQFAGVVEKILNKKTNSDAALAAMGKQSQKIIEPYTHNTYIDKLKI